jgi:hypothetical protein
MLAGRAALTPSQEEHELSGVVAGCRKSLAGVVQFQVSSLSDSVFGKRCRIVRMYENHHLIGFPKSARRAYAYQKINPVPLANSEAMVRRSFLRPPDRCCGRRLPFSLR